MNCINGKTLYCRDAEENVISVFIGSKKTDRKLSVRDRVIVRADNSASYTLWNTELVRRLTDGRIWIYITDNSDMDYVFYHGWHGRPKAVAMTQTTKNRLNCFLQYYGFNPLEVHSSKKLFGVWHNGRELENDSWYELDFTSHELVKID